MGWVGRKERGERDREGHKKLLLDEGKYKGNGIIALGVGEGALQQLTPSPYQKDISCQFILIRQIITLRTNCIGQSFALSPSIGRLSAPDCPLARAQKELSDWSAVD